jgi:hypothetical protein
MGDAHAGTAEASAGALLNRAAYLRKYAVGIAADQAYGAYDNHQNNRQHDGVFGNVLASLIAPKLLYEFHWLLSSTVAKGGTCGRKQCRPMWAKICAYVEMLIGPPGYANGPVVTPYGTKVLSP